jgi:GNAT superfamily N-acetyltransferase
MRIHVRPIRPTDEELQREMFYNFSPETVYRRFFQALPAMPHERLQRFSSIDYDREMALVGVVQEDEHDTMVAVSRYIVDKATNAAEVAFVVRDDYQRQGIGTYLFKRLLEVARTRGITVFTADVLAENTAMLHVFHECATGPIQSTLDAGVYHLSFAIQ